MSCATEVLEAALTPVVIIRMHINQVVRAPGIGKHVGLGIRACGILRPRGIPWILARRLLRQLIREHPEGGHFVRAKLHCPSLRRGSRQRGQCFRGERRLRKGWARELAYVGTWREIRRRRRAVEADGANGRLEVCGGNLRRRWLTWRGGKRGGSGRGGPSFREWRLPTPRASLLHLRLSLRASLALLRAALSRQAL